MTIPARTAVYSRHHGFLLFLLTGLAATPAAAVDLPVAQPLNAYPSTTAASVNESGVLERLKGVYKYRFQNGTVFGNLYTSEDILEIVPYGEGAAYFRVHLEFYNGHLCGLHGIARVEGEKLVYEVPTPNGFVLSCRVEIKLASGIVSLNDTPDHSCNDFCGFRGSMHGEWSYTARRKIRYMRTLLGSRQYQEAVNAFEKR